MTTATLPVDSTLPTADHLRIPVSAMRPGDIVRLGYARFVVTYELSPVGGASGRMLADTANGNERELHGPDAVKYSVERPVFTVEYRDTDRRELSRVEFGTELDAVHAASSYQLYANTELVAVGSNIDFSRYSV
jgi:hypothetical protein